MGPGTQRHHGCVIRKDRQETWWEVLRPMRALSGSILLQERVRSQQDNVWMFLPIGALASLILA